MSGRAYLLVVIVCAAWLGARAATQPAGFDFDESFHLRTIAQIRFFGGLPPAELYPDIVFDRQTIQTSYHSFSPMPYLLVAVATAVARVDPTPEGVLGIARVFSAILAVITVVGAGIATRNLQDRGSTWTAPVVVTVGLSLMPGLHSMGASMTASAWASAGVGLIAASTTWALRRRWSLGSTLAVAASTALVVGARASAYPVLLLIPITLLAAHRNPSKVAFRLSIVMAIAFAVNGWWLVRTALITGDLLGTGTHVQVHIDKGHFDSVRESTLWNRAASAAWPEWTLLTTSDWLWVGLSRMLVRKTWVDPLTLVIWSSFVLVPAVAVAAARVRGDRQISSPHLATVGAGVLMPAVGFGLNLSLSAHVGWFASLRDTFILSIPLVIAIAALADLRQDRLRSICFGSGLVFAAAANAGFMLGVLP